MELKKVLAFDLGASGGRAMLGVFDGKTISLEEIHRFDNVPFRLCGTLYWDIGRLFADIKQGILKALEKGGFDSIGVDTWGVDFGLLSEDGQLLENPVHYRDLRTKGMLDAAFSEISRERFYQITGNQFMEINTVFQFLYLARKRPHILQNARRLLMMPDLINYFLTGREKTELSIASTTQMTDAVKREWSGTVLDALSLPRKLLSDEIIPPGTVIGSLHPDLREELGLPASVSPKITAVCGHDTACAVAAVPATVSDFIFISCGTWSLFGTELDSPLIGEKSLKYNLTNEAGFGGKVTFLKNIIGLWLIQESRRRYRREGRAFSFAELEAEAKQAQPFACFINPDSPEFAPEGDIPERVKSFCKRTGQSVPDTAGGVMRCIYESLALKHRQAFEEIKSCTEKDYNRIYIVGGGIKDEFLCQITADATGREVFAGPAEATAYGNAAIQLIASGDIADLNAARDVIAASKPVKVYKPVDYGAWDNAYKRFIKICGL